MTLIDAETGEIVADVMSGAEAREADEAFDRHAGDALAEALRIWNGRGWLHLGFGRWDDWCESKRQVGFVLPRDHIPALRESGMSTRAIAAATGVSPATVTRAPTVSNETVAPEDDAEAAEPPAPKPVVGLDGKTRTYPAPKPKPPVTKPDLGGGVSHPARYSPELLPVFAELLDGYHRVLDPFAGTGRIHDLQAHGHDTVGVEIEPEWAGLHPDTICGDALDLSALFPAASFDAICTSPTYGNRLADSHNASDPHLRRSYTHDLGRPLADNNSGAMQWGEDYRNFHHKVWHECLPLLRPGGRFVLNIKDHIRGGQWQDVAGWHLNDLLGHMVDVVAIRPIVTGHLRQGANGDRRVDAELVIVVEVP